MQITGNNQPLSRRQLLTYASALSGIAVLSACTAPMIVVQPITTAPEGQGGTNMLHRNNSEKPIIVLVHGAFAESSSWDGVIQILQGRGYTTVAAANPLRSLASDAESVANILKNLEAPIVLVGHSYGGCVITGAARDNEKVKALVYVAAFAPDEGENAIELSTRFPGSTLGESLWPVPLVDGTTDLYIHWDKFHHQFAGDVAVDKTILMAATQRPVRDVALGEALAGAPAWKSIPSWFLLAEQDQNIPVALQRFMAERAQASEVVEVKGASHAAAVSNPQEVAEIILRAAASVEPISYNVDNFYIAESRVQS